jgi:hypothetical protein
VQLIAPSWPL